MTVISLLLAAHGSQLGTLPPAPGRHPRGAEAGCRCRKRTPPRLGHRTDGCRHRAAGGPSNSTIFPGCTAGGRCRGRGRPPPAVGLGQEVKRPCTAHTTAEGLNRVPWPAPTRAAPEAGRAAAPSAGRPPGPLHTPAGQTARLRVRQPGQLIACAWCPVTSRGGVRTGRAPGDTPGNRHQSGAGRPHNRRTAPASGPRGYRPASQPPAFGSSPHGPAGRPTQLRQLGLQALHGHHQPGHEGKTVGEGRGGHGGHRTAKPSRLSSGRQADQTGSTSEWLLLYFLDSSL